MLSPVLRRWYSLCITGQSSFFFYGVHRNEQVPWLHPPSRAMIWSTVQTICQRNRSTPSIRTGTKCHFQRAATIPNYFGQKPGYLGLRGRMSCIVANVSVLFRSQRLCHDAIPDTLKFSHCLYSHSSIIFGNSVAKTTKLLSALLKRGNNQKCRTKEGVFFSFS